MQIRKTQTTFIDGEDRAVAEKTSGVRRPLKYVALKNQSGLWAASFGTEPGKAMKIGKACAITIDREHRALAEVPSVFGGPIDNAARFNQSACRVSEKRIVAIAIVTKTMEIRKTRAIGLDAEHGADRRIATTIRRSIEGVAGQNQTFRIGSIAVGKVRVAAKIMQVCKTRAVGVYRKYDAGTPTSATTSRTVEPITCYLQTSARIGSVAVGVRRRARRRCENI